MADPQNVGGIRARVGRRPLRKRGTQPDHYLSKAEAAELARKLREKAEARGIYRRWNGRKLTPEQIARRLARPPSSALRPPSADAPPQ